MNKPESDHPARKHRPLRPRWVLLGLVVLIGVGFAATWLFWPGMYGRGSSDNPGHNLTATVGRGTLTVTIKDDGEVAAAKRRIIRNELRWSAYIEDVWPNGTVVPKGKPIITFKCDELDEAILDQEQQVADAKNSLEQAEANLELRKKETDYLVRQALEAVKEAEEDEKRYSDPGGEGDVKLKEAQSAIQLAKQELKLAEAKRDFKLKANKELAPNSPYSQNEIEADQLAVDRQRLSLEKAENHLRMLQTYDLARDKRRLQVASEAARLAYERAVFNAEQELAKAKRDRDHRKFVFEMHQRKYDEYLDDREKRVRVVAEEDGLVVYDTGGSRHRPSDVVVERGEKVNPRQQLMIIPDMTTLQVECKIYEAMLAELKKRLKETGGEPRRQRPAGQREQASPSDPQQATYAAAAEEGGAPREPRKGQRPRADKPSGEMPTSRPTSQPSFRPAEGQRIDAYVELPALGGKVAKGYVYEVAPMAEEKSEWLSPGVKIYKVIVKMDNVAPGLQPKMTARVTLVLAELKNVLKVPVAAVFAEPDNTTYCWRKNGGSAEKVKIKIGRCSAEEVEILSGLEEDDEVLLVAPPVGTVNNTETGEPKTPAPRQSTP